MEYARLFSAIYPDGSRYKAIAAICLNIFISLLDALAVVAVAPLVQVMLTGEIGDGIPGAVAALLGVNTVPSMVALLLIIVVGGILIKDICSIIFSWWLTGFSTSMIAEIQSRIIEGVMYLPLSQHAELSAARVMRLVNTAVTQTYLAFGAGLINVAAQISVIFWVLVGLFYAAPAVAAILLLFSALIGGGYYFTIRSAARRFGKEAVDAAQEVLSSSFDILGGIREIQLRWAHQKFLVTFQRAARKSCRAARIAQFFTMSPRYVLEIVFMIALGLAVGVASSMDTILPTLAVLVAGAFRLLPNISALLATLSSVKAGHPACLEVLAAMRRYHDPRADRELSATSPLRFKGAIETHAVSYMYQENGPEILKEISIRIDAGTTVAIVGPSGSGKSTLVDILMGLARPTDGEVLVDGVALENNRLAWQKCIGNVPQSVYLMDKSLAENIAFDVFAKQSIDEERVRNALKRADLLAFVENQPRGIWTVFGEQGKQLSGGQRQRIGLARALYREPSVLVLDEATSALDNATEARIVSTIDAMRGDLTVIVVAHRLSTIRNADQIIYLENGRVTAQGTFSELIDNSESFRELVRLGSLRGQDG